MRSSDNPYEFNVIGADGQRVVETAAGHVGLFHGENYKIHVINRSQEKVGVHVFVDGEPIGAWLIRSGNELKTERHGLIERKLAFFKAGTPEAFENMLDGVAPEKLGLIELRILPESYEVIPASANEELPQSGRIVGTPIGLHFSSGSGTPRFGAGGTGLGKRSEQTFTKVEFRGDKSRTVHLALRLIYDATRVPTPIAKSSFPLR